MSAAERFDDDFPLLPYAGASSGWSGTDTSRERADRRDADGSTESMQRRMLEAVALTGTRGLTNAEAARLVPEHWGNTSGALSNLHLKGRVTMLADERRQNCHPYVLPEHVDGRRTLTQGRGMPNANRNRGDYLERTTKAALSEHGWVAVRAAGSLGVADVVALRQGSTPLLIACKTNGKLPPAERAALVGAAEMAGARPILATRTRRGWIDFLLVNVDGARLYGDPVKVPGRDKEGGDEGGDGD